MNVYIIVRHQALVLLCILSSLHGMESHDIHYKQITLHKNPERLIYGVRLLRDTLYLITSNADEHEPLKLHMKGFNTDTGNMQKKSGHNLACLLAASGVNWESHLWRTNQSVLPMLQRGIIPTIQFPNHCSGIIQKPDGSDCFDLSVYNFDGDLKKTFDHVLNFTTGFVNKNLITMTIENRRTLQFYDENFAPVSTFTLPENDDLHIANFGQLNNRDIVVQKIRVADGNILSSRVCVYNAQKQGAALFEQDGMLKGSANRSFLIISNDARTVTWYTRDTANAYIPCKSFTLTNSDRNLMMSTKATPEPKVLRPYCLYTAHTNDVVFSRPEYQDTNTIQATVYKADGTVQQIIPDLSDRATFIYSDGTFFTAGDPNNVHFYMPTTSGDYSPMILDEKSDDLAVIEKLGLKIADIKL